LTFSLAASRIAAGRIPVGMPEPARWPSLLKPAMWVMLNTFLAAVQQHGPAIVIGIVHGSVVTGLYYWGFQLSAQSLLILSTNLKDVIFPILTKLNADRERQYQAFRRACRAMIIIVGPICVLQACLAEPLVQLLFHSRWHASASVIKWLSLGFISQPLYMMAFGLLMARGSFRRLCVTSGMVATGLLAATVVGAYAGGADVIAMCNGGACLVAYLAAAFVAFRQFGRGWRHLAQTIAAPVAVTVAVALAGWATRTSCQSFEPLGQVSVTCSVMVAVHLMLAWRLMPEDSIHLVRRLGFSR